LSSARGQLLRRPRSRVLALARRAGVSNVRLFGSVARGSDDAGSDIDLLVDHDVSRGVLPLLALRRQLSEPWEPPSTWHHLSG